MLGFVGYLLHGGIIQLPSYLMSTIFLHAQASNKERAFYPYSEKLRGLRRGLITRPDTGYVNPICLAI